MKNKKIIVILLIIIIAIIAIYFGVRVIKINKYTKADEYEVKGVKIASVKKAIGEKKIKSYSHKNGSIERLELVFKDSNKEQSAKEYLDYIKNSGNYIDMDMKEENKKQIACSDKELITVETEITNDGFKIIIEVGPGTIKVNPQE